MPTSKKSAAKKKPAAKKPVHKPAKPAAAKPSPKAAAPKKPAAPAPAVKPAAAKGGKQPLNASELKRMLLERKAAPKAIAFSLDEVREIAKKNEKQIESAAKNGKNG